MLERLLKERKAAILDGWMERILASYPKDSSRFLVRKGDPFGNPIGSTFQKYTEIIIEQLGGDRDQECMDAALLEMVKMRAVQQFSPSQALNFLLTLREVVRGALTKEELAGAAMEQELEGLDGDVERLLLKAFDQYASCREQMFEIRVREIRGQTAKLVERMNRMHGGGLELD